MYINIIVYSVVSHFVKQVSICYCHNMIGQFTIYNVTDSQVSM